jgi:DivIVA domain-containing protein
MDPDEIERRDFMLSLRGYSRAEVDDFLQEVAQEIRELNRQLDLVSSELEGKSAELASKTAQLDEVQGGSSIAVPGISQARFEGLKKEHLEVLQQERMQALEKVGEETRSILLAAEQVATEMHERATREAAEIITDARMEAERIFRGVEDRMRHEQHDVDEINEVRGMLASQLEDIRRRIEETISRLRTPVEPLPKVNRIRPVLVGTPHSASAPPSPAVPEVKAPAPGIEASAPEIMAPVPEPASGIPAAPPEEPPQPAPPAPGLEPVGEGAPSVELAPSEAEASSEVAQQPARDEELGSEEDPILQLLEEIHRERETVRQRRGKPARSRAATPVEAPPEETTPAPASQEEVAVAGQGVETTVQKEEESPTEPVAPESPPAAEARMLKLRAEALGDMPTQASRRLKRLLQEDQNDLLDRLRTQKGRGALEDNLPSVQEQFGRFQGALGEVLGRAFEEGRKVAGAEDTGDPTKAVGNLLARQVLNPLRGEISRTVKAGLEAGDTPNSIAERASDIFRVWKGIRTQLLGEGMVYAAFHQGLADVWNRMPGAQKTWISGPEQECPNEVCSSNVSAGPVAVQSAFPSGHINPPAHGGCTCTLEGPGEIS